MSVSCVRVCALWNIIFRLFGLCFTDHHIDRSRMFYSNQTMKLYSRLNMLKGRKTPDNQFLFTDVHFLGTVGHTQLSVYPRVRWRLVGFP